MTEYGKIKKVADIARAALGIVEIDAKDLEPKEVKKAVADDVKNSGQMEITEEADETKAMKAVEIPAAANVDATDTEIEKDNAPKEKAEEPEEVEGTKLDEPEEAKVAKIEGARPSLKDILSHP